MAKVKNSFPKLPVNFFDILADRIIENEFNNERLIASINNVIDNCVYPTPSIAQFISYDSKIKTYKYHEMTKMVHEQDIKFEDYTKVRIYPEQKKPLWIENDLFNMYKLTEF
jgi:hypothetical protein